MEQRLIQRCKDGDLRAFEVVFDCYGRKLFGLCLRMSGNRADAEDLMQEIFVIAMSRIKAFRGESKFSTWLYRVAVNTCISHLRKRSRTAERFVPADVGSVSETAGVDPTPVVARETLKRAIAELPAGYRASIVLHDIQGFNHKEIGKMMGISVGASKSQLFKARRRLRELIEPQGSGLSAHSGSPAWGISHD